MRMPIQGSGGLSWLDVTSNLKTQGSLNKQYDTNLDGVIDWNALQFPGVRQEILAKFSDPKILIATSSMLMLLNSADKVEAAAGNISATSQELTIVGGTATASGTSYVYWVLPQTATKVYITALMQAVQVSANPVIEVSAGSPDINNVYRVWLRPDQAAADFALKKSVNSVVTTLATEAVDLTAGVYKVEMFVDGGSNNIQVWRDNVLKFNVIDTSFSSFNSVILRCYDTSTTAALSAKFKGPVVVIYE